MLFFAERKERKEAASLRLDRLCGRQRFGGGYERRRPRSLRSRDPSTAAPFLNIAPDGAHTARALRLRARASQRQLLPARRMLACRAKREQTTIGSRGYALPSRSMRVRDGSLGESFGAFLLSEKSTYFSPLAKEKRVLFLYGQEKNEKKLQAYRLTVCAAGSSSVAAIKDGIHARFVRVIRGPPPFSQTSLRKALIRRAPCACGPCASFASTATPFEPWVYTSQQKHESPRRESR